MDDYYELLGVDADAAVDDIRAAYRDQQGGARQRAPTRARADAGRLNKAWNVLSDPYQRGRYDEQRERRDADGDDERRSSTTTTPARRNGELEPVEAPAASASKPQSTREQRAKRARAAAADGRRCRPGRTGRTPTQRIIAMVIDLARAAS